VTAIFSVALVALAAQIPAGSARFVLFDGNPPGTPQREFLERMVRAIPHKVTLAGNNNLAEVMNELAEDLKKANGRFGSGSARDVPDVPACKSLASCGTRRILGFPAAKGRR